MTLVYKDLGLKEEDLVSGKALAGILTNSEGVSENLKEIMGLLGMEDTKANKVIAFSFFSYGYNAGERFGDPKLNQEFLIFALKQLEKMGEIVKKGDNNDEEKSKSYC
jgi:hypothetical protein